MKTTNHETNETHIYRSTLQDYWVDFIGGLLPGALFLVAMLLIFFPTLLVFSSSISKDISLDIVKTLSSLITVTKNTPSVLWFGIVGIIFSIIYIVGHIFYRKDPQLPNQKSFRKLLIEAAEKNNINIQKYEDNLKNDTLNEEEKELRDTLKKEYGCTSESDCEFPYPYFSDYLENRGLDYLQKYVLWKNHTYKRTKNAINILKIRIRFFFPDRCGTIIRNEAHVRLASSVWHVGGTICVSSMLGLALLSISMLITIIRYGYSFSNAWNAIPDFYSQSGVVSIIIIILGTSGWLAVKNIESFLHYQRQREVVHVLETAWTAFAKDKETHMPFEEKIATNETSTA